MLSHVLLKWSIPAIFLASILVVHLRGRVRHSFWKQVFDHSGLLAPVNVFLYATSAVPNKPYLPVSTFPELDLLIQNFDTIKAEGLALMEATKLRRPDQNDDAGFNSFAKSGWKRFYLKWYDDAHPSASRLCPKTTALLQQIPSIKAAMFTELPPGATLSPHRDPYAGSLRYHLGIATPNSDNCFIDVDGQRYSWRDGEGVIFDESFIHHVENNTDQNRLIFFADIERPQRWGFARAFNHWFGRHIVAAAASPNEQGDKTGLVNRLFIISAVMGQWRRRFKNWNKTVYQLTKLALVAAVVAWLVWG